MMALFSCGRLGSKSVLANISKLPATLSSAKYAAAPSISIKKFEEPKPEHFEIRNERLNRPLSPHITIYAFPLPAWLSISHRATGIILTTYTSALGIGALCLPNDITHYVQLIEGLNLNPAVLLLAKALIASPLGYHLANGIRHLYWDTSKGLTMKEVYATGYAMLAVTTVITLVLASL